VAGDTGQHLVGQLRVAAVSMDPHKIVRLASVSIQKIPVLATLSRGLMRCVMADVSSGVPDGFELSRGARALLMAHDRWTDGGPDIRILLAVLCPSLDHSDAKPFGRSTARYSKNDGTNQIGPKIEGQRLAQLPADALTAMIEFAEPLLIARGVSWLRPRSGTATVMSRCSRR
jgi:hypothetical protein